MMNNNRVFQIMTLIWWSSFEEYFTFILFFQNKSCVTRFRKRLGNPVTLGCEPRKTYGKSQPQNLPQKGHVSRLGYETAMGSCRSTSFFQRLGRNDKWGVFRADGEMEIIWKSCIYIYIDVSENSGFSPKSSILIGCSIIFTIHIWVVVHFFLFSPLLFGEDFQFDEHIFQRGWNHQLDIYIYTHIEKLQPVVNAHFLYVEPGKAQVVLRLKLF